MTCAGKPQPACWQPAPGGRRRRARPGRVRAVAEAREIAVLDAPASGMAAGAQAGTLQIFAGGSAETYQRVRPLPRGHAGPGADHACGAERYPRMPTGSDIREMLAAPAIG